MRTLARHKATLVVTAIVLAALAAAALLAGGRHRASGDLDPDNPDPAGAQAVARVLADHGIDVTVARSAADLETIDVTGATVLVTSTENLGSRTASRLREHAAHAHLIVTEPAEGLDEFGVPGGAFVSLTDPRAADCTDRRLAGLEIEVDSATEYPTPQGCFGGDHGFLVASPSAQVTVLGAGKLLSNDQILRADNAAAALRLLGERPRLVWYVPSLADVAPGDGVGIGRFLPRWLTPALWLCGVAVIGLMFWRGRRLGPLAVEPLPVVVKAIETTRARGRLYRKVNDRVHAADALRAAARTRLADRLRLPHSAIADPHLLAQAVATRTGHPWAEIASLIDPHAPLPRTDRELVSLANALAELDREVRRT